MDMIKRERLIILLLTSLLLIVACRPHFGFFK